MDNNHDSPWLIHIPVESNLHWQYSLRSWSLNHNPLWDQSAPIEWHELSPEECAFMGEPLRLNLSVLRYDPPNPTGNTVWGMYHHEMKLVLWLQRLPNNNKKGDLAQVGLTTRGNYDPQLTPAHNDALGRIKWFSANNKWYPRTWLKSTSWPGQAWSELWAPFSSDSSGSVFQKHYYSVSMSEVKFQARKYTGPKVSVVGPAGNDPQNMIVREASIFVHNLGIVARHRALTTNKSPQPPLPASTTFLVQAISLEDVFSQRPFLLP